MANVLAPLHFPEATKQPSLVSVYLRCPKSLLAHKAV